MSIERIQKIENRMDDFNIRNEKFYAQLKEYIDWLEERITILELNFKGKK